ncbi:Ulp1 peptidase [Salvia divinorum]|uniref:Ulp1 peptidase n=1 Tax=Salvia divinorum TaxID=28513 RepID=A0ABD1IAV0_SALDI
MGKRRNANKKPAAAVAQDNAANNGGGRSINNIFSAFEFSNGEELLVEAHAREAVAKFGIQSPSNKSVRCRKSIDKYDFLVSFTQGIQSKQKHLVNNDELGVAATDGEMSLGSSNHEPGTLSPLECQSSAGTSGVKSCPGRRRKPGCHSASKKHEAVVVVAPYYVKLEKKYHSRCVFTFSQRCIRLEGLPLCNGKGTHCVEWPTSDILNIEHQHYDKGEVINLQLSYKDANGDKTGSLELEFVILDDPQWFEKQEEIKSLDMKYDVSWKTSVIEYCFEESFEEVVYPDGDPDAVIINRRDIEVLQPRTFINDTIIDFYFRYLQTNIKAEEHRFHFFNTFFFQKLVAGGREGRNAFLSVRKWTRNVNLFEKDYIFIPINFSLHWSLIIICHLGEAAHLKSKNTDQASKVPRILHMDSIRGSHGGLEKLIKSYLSEEWKERGNERQEELAVKFRQLDFVSLQLPQQDNLCDCGLFLLHYSELFLELVSNGSTTEYINFLDEDWFLPAEVSLKKRDHIRKLIHKLIQDKAQKDAAAGNNKYLGRGVRESSARSVLKNGGEDLCGGINLNLEDDLETPGQQCFAPMLEQTGKSSPKECHQPHKLRVPINQFNSLSLPLEQALAEQTTVLQRDIGSSYETDEVMLPHCQLNRSLCEVSSDEKSWMTSKDIAACAVEDSEDEKSWTTSKDLAAWVVEDSEDEKSWTTSKDLAACVVEDSEDEVEVVSIRRTRRQLMRN